MTHYLVNWKFRDIGTLIHSMPISMDVSANDANQIYSTILKTVASQSGMGIENICILGIFLLK